MIGSVRAPEFVEAGVRMRTTGSTAIELAGDAHFHRVSTERIDVVAAWSEWVDEGPGTAPPAHRSIDGRIVEVIPGVRIAPARPTGILPIRVSHDFGDTRRREVRYSLVDATRTSEPLEVDLPATSSPPPPTVSHVVPRHTGHRVCLHLERPWYESGQGELVGVLVAPSRGGCGAGSTDVSTWDGSPSSAARLEDFPARVASRTGVRIPGTSSVVDVAGHQVRFDSVTDRWCCELVVGRTGPQRPRPLRLVVVRFQPHAVEGAHVSAAAALPAVVVPGSGPTIKTSSADGDGTVTGLSR